MKDYNCEMAPSFLPSEGKARIDIMIIWLIFGSMKNQYCSINHTEKLSPQPQLRLALGLLK